MHAGHFPYLSSSPNAMFIRSNIWLWGRGWVQVWELWQGKLVETYCWRKYMASFNKPYFDHANRPSALKKFSQDCRGFGEIESIFFQVCTYKIYRQKNQEKWSCVAVQFVCCADEKYAGSKRFSRWHKNTKTRRWNIDDEATKITCKNMIPLQTLL